MKLTTSLARSPAKLPRRASKPTIVTLDTDLVQLIGPNVNLFMFRPYQRDMVMYDEAKAAERWGFSPKYMIDFKALKGDTSDNIEGIKGIGEKTATDLIRQFGDVDQIYENIELVKGASVRQKLKDGEAQAKANINIVTIHTDLPIDFDLESLPRQGLRPQPRGRFLPRARVPDTHPAPSRDDRRRP